MKYLNKSFSVSMSGSDKFDKNWDSIFKKPLSVRIHTNLCTFIYNLLYNLFIK